MGRPTNEVPPMPPADVHAAAAVGLLELPDPNDIAPFPELSPPYASGLPDLADFLTPESLMLR